MPCANVDQRIPELLDWIAVNPDMISAIRNTYQTEVKNIPPDDRQTQLAELKRQVSELKEEEVTLGRLLIRGRSGDDAYEKLRTELSTSELEGNVVSSLVAWIDRIGLQSTMSEHGIGPEIIDTLIESISGARIRGNFGADFATKGIRRIYEESL